MNISARTLIWWESWQGEAIANLLYGRVSPCGRLTENWPLTYEDVPSSEIFGKYKDALYQEGIYAGYRYYDKADVKVCWPFGYGLSYTDFTYRDLEISEKAENNIGTDRNGACDVSITVKNTGSRPGAEVVQLYIMPPEEKGGVRCGLHRPVRELKGFRKVFLQPGESTKVSFVLEERSFAVWQEGWKVPEGSYTVCIGGLSAAIEKRGGSISVPAWQPGSWYETCQGKPSLKEWETMMGKTYVAMRPVKGQFTMDNTVEEMKEDSFIMKIMYKAVEATVAKGYGGRADYENPEFRMLMASSAGSPCAVCRFPAA